MEGKVMQTTLRLIARFGLVFVLMAGLQVVASAQGRGRGAGAGRPAGPPSNVGVDRGISTSSDRSNGRADTGRSTASNRSNGRSDAGLAAGKSIGQTLQDLGLSKQAAKDAEKRADREIKDAKHH